MDRANYLSTEQAAELVERLGLPRPHQRTVWRWCTAGIDGVTLKHVKRGRLRYTTEAWVREFLAATCTLPVEGGDA